MSFLLADTVICRNGRLLTGSVGKNLRMWSLTGVRDMRSGDSPSMPCGGLTMEDEMNLEGSVVAAAFDEALDMVSNSTEDRHIGTVEIKRFCPCFIIIQDKNDM